MEVKGFKEATWTHVRTPHVRGGGLFPKKQNEKERGKQRDLENRIMTLVVLQLEEREKLISL